MITQPKIEFDRLGVVQLRVPTSSGGWEYARRRPDPEFTVLFQHGDRFWTVDDSPEDGWYDVQDVTTTMREILAERSLRARMREHIARQKKRQALVQAAASEPSAWQEQKAATAAVMVRLTAQRALEKARRRLLDARLWNGLTSDQQDAAEQIVFGFESLTAGIGYRGQRFKPREIGAAEAQDARRASPTYAQQLLIDCYLKWALRAEKAGLSVDAAMEILAAGKSCSAADKSRRRRNGWARRNLVKCLDIYCRLRRHVGNQPSQAKRDFAA